MASPVVRYKLVCKEEGGRYSLYDHQYRVRYEQNEETEGSVGPLMVFSSEEEAREFLERAPVHKVWELWKCECDKKSTQYAAEAGWVLMVHAISKHARRLWAAIDGFTIWGSNNNLPTSKALDGTEFYWRVKLTTKLQGVQDAESETEQ